MIRLINIFVVAISVFSCKEPVPKTNDVLLQKNEAKVENAQIAAPEQKNPSNEFDINGTWTCYKYTEDLGQQKEYDDDFAKEVSRFSRFVIDNHKMTMGSCSKNIYIYRYPTKLTKFEEESLFITYLKPKRDSVSFVGVVNSSENHTDCDIVDNFTFYIDGQNLIHHDRGYFFYYKKNHENEPLSECEIKGTPGNNRNYWNVTCTLDQSSSLKEGYDFFRKNFAYGAKNLSSTIPTPSEFFDKEYRISYSKTDNGLQITKDDPMGKVYISLTKKGKSVLLNYEMQYPEY